MENSKKLIVIIAVFALVMVGAYALYTQLSSRVEHDQLAVLDTQATQPQTPTGDTSAPEEHDHDHEGKSLAPDFTVYDAEGNEVHLSDYFGKPIVLNFWASWCGPCQMEMPDFNEKFLALGDEVQFLMVNMTDGDRETVETASAFISQKGYAFPVLFDKTYDAANAYGAYSLPMTVLIDSSGHIVAYATGAIDAATLQQGIDLIS